MPPPSTFSPQPSSTVPSATHGGRAPCGGEPVRGSCSRSSCCVGACPPNTVQGGTSPVSSCSALEAPSNNLVSGVPSGGEPLRGSSPSSSFSADRAGSTAVHTWAQLMPSAWGSPAGREWAFSDTAKLMAAGGVSGVLAKTATAPLGRLTILYQARFGQGTSLGAFWAGNSERSVAGQGCSSTCMHVFKSAKTHACRVEFSKRKHRVTGSSDPGRTYTSVHVRMCVRPHGCMCAWAHERMGARTCGCMAA
eukprot:366505-Chlamydomonas_euryale.AAC.1